VSDAWTGDRAADIEAGLNSPATGALLRTAGTTAADAAARLTSAMASVDQAQLGRLTRQRPMRRLADRP